jgi:predicted kinase
MSSGYNQNLSSNALDVWRKQLLGSRKKRIFMTVGLPASGKTTWAREYVTSNLSTIRVNKDEIRQMLHNGIYSEGREEFVIAIRNSIIRTALDAGCDVIVDDTNFNPKHQMSISAIAHEYDALVEIKNFTDVPLEVCLERNHERGYPVPQEAIERMHEQYVKVED